ncbi:hypothetical protein ADL35_05675, partial [Streptomyces sp. NRRL WC-3753]
SPRTGRNVVSIGRLADQKGVDMLLDTWALVAPHRPDWRLRIYGAGEDETALKNQCTSLGLDSSVEWRGRTDDVPAALKLAPPSAAPQAEALALERWDGWGACRLLGRPAPGALLLERLRPDVSLRSLAQAKALLEA